MKKRKEVFRNLELYLKSVESRLEKRPDFNEGVSIFNDIQSIIYAMSKTDQYEATHIYNWLTRHKSALQECSTTDDFKKHFDDWQSILWLIIRAESEIVRPSELGERLEMLLEMAD